MNFFVEVMYLSVCPNGDPKIKSVIYDGADEPVISDGMVIIRFEENGKKKMMAYNKDRVISIECYEKEVH